MAAFDIFSGHIDHEPIWIACAEGMENAKATMERLATERPGKYFVWESCSRKVLAVGDAAEQKKAAD